MSSLSSLVSYVGASLPVVLLAGLLWVTATVLDSDASHSPRKRRVPGAWDSHDDEHLLFSSPSPSPPPRPPSVIRTVSSAISPLPPFSEPRSISSTSLVISCPSPLPSSSPTSKKRPSARASSTGVSQTSTLPKTYSHLTSSQYRSSFTGDGAVSKALRQGLLTYEAVDNVLYGRWSLSHALEQSAKALASPGRKNFPPVARSAGYPLADADAYASHALALESLSSSSPEKKEVSPAMPVEEHKPIDAETEVNAVVLTESPAETTLSPPEPAPSAPIEPSAEPSAEPTFLQPETAPFARAASASLAAKLKFDGFRCGFAPLAAFFLCSQTVQPDLPLPAPSTTTSAEMVLEDLPTSLPSLPPVEDMELETRPPRAAPTTQSSPGILRKVSLITKQFANLQVQCSSAPVDISPLVEMMARLSLNDKQQTCEAQITQPPPARPRQIQQQVKPRLTLTPAPPSRTAVQAASREAAERHGRRAALCADVHKRRLQAAGKQASSSSSSGQPSSVPAPARPAKTEKKQNTSAPAQSSSLSSSSSSASATPKPLPKSAAPAIPPRPDGQLSLPAMRAKPPIAAASKPLPPVADPKPTATSSSSGQSPSAPARASAAKTETKTLSTMGAINPLLANMLDSFEAEETEAKADKPRPKPEPKPEPEAAPDEELSMDDLESQLAFEELEMEKKVKQVPKFEGNDRKIAPLRRK